MTITIFINDEKQQVDENATLKSAVEQFGAQPPYALLLNQTFVPASEHEQTKLNPNDRIDVISAIQGG